MCELALRPGWRIGTLVLATAILGCGDRSGPPQSAPPPAAGTGNEPARPAPTAGQAGLPAPTAPAAAVDPPPAFAGWKNPAAVLFLTGQQRGYIEPCGCTGLENQKGGLARRHTFLKQLRDEKGWAVVPLDVGSQVRRYGGQPEIKFARTADALRTMGYRAVVLGKDDLRLPAGSLFGATHIDDKPSIFTSANVALFDPTAQPPFQVIEAGGKKIGVIGILGDSFEQKLQGDELVHVSAAEGLNKAVADLKEQGCDYHVLLAHATVEEAQELTRQAPLVDLVVCSGGGGLPSSELESIEGAKAKLLKISHKAMHVGVVGLFDDETSPVRYQSVALDSKFADSPEMLRLLADYQQQLQATPWEELGIKPQPHPSGNRYVGSATCGECHTKAMAIWSKTPHAHATESLVHPPNSRGDIARHHDPECLSCHVTGWEPQKFYPFESGYLSLDETPQLQHNGCENCHGPGSAHVAAENGEGNPTDETVGKLRDSMKLPIAGGAAENKCRECHDEDNSPDFSHKGFAAYWKEVEHQGKD